MALPTDSNDTFFREVDESLRRDEMQAMGRKYGGWIIGAVILFLAAVGGWLYWQDRQRVRTGEGTEQLVQVFTDVATNKMATVPQRLGSLSEAENEIVAASALFAQGAVALQQNDRTLAAEKYRQAAADEDLPDAYRNLALVRATTIEFDTIKPEEVISRMEPLSKAGEPWFGSAGELTAMAYIKQGKKQEAGRLFAAIAGDRQVPESVRARAVQIAGTLGVDASGAFPELAQ